MLDLFTIFSKGGIVLWCFQGTGQALTSPVNALIKTVILQERGGSSSFTHEALTLKYKLDNEFELVFVVAYQKILQLSYIDKFLTDIQMEFRDKYKDDLHQGNVSRNFDDFEASFQDLLRQAEEEAKNCAKEPRKMRSFKQSGKSQKTVASMIERKTDEPKSRKNNKKGKNETNSSERSRKSEMEDMPARATSSAPAVGQQNHTGASDQLPDDVIRKNRENFLKKRMGPAKKSNKEEKKSPSTDKKPGAKSARVWALGGNSSDTKILDYSGGEGVVDRGENGGVESVNSEEQSLVGQMKGDLQDMETYSSSEEEEEEEGDTQEVKQKAGKAKPSSSGFGFLSGLKNLVGSKQLTREDIQPALDKMKDHLIAKNVAAEIADKLCESVASKLEGRVLGTFSTVMSTVKQSLQDSCMQLLRPRRRVDILRDAMAAREARRPYSITFCGVNGVGKSTNLAKICFWLVENGLRVLIAACDTFRAGAVEQLRTHTRKLNALHPPDAHGGRQMVQLYEKGYGKDAAGIAMEAINMARDMKIDVVLIDTAGRMQDNEPLMRALSKLIAVNQPDLVLFVGEALVGNEAVDQLVKFNQALADHSQMANPRLIDGMVLTKFDTIDDKVGAAISMTYTTGQPIVFVGTGQTYTDLKNLNPKAVVHALLKV